MKSFTSVDAYIESFPDDVKAKLQTLRNIIQKTVPEATEGISYGMPSYKLNGPLVYFGGFKDHISLFPTGSGVAALKKDLVGYETTKGTIHFPLDKPLPLPLIKKVVEFKVQENSNKKGGKK